MHIRENCKFHKDLIECLSDKMKKDDKYALDMYRALCNMRWQNDFLEDVYSCSWRYAGGLVAEIRNKGEDYLDFYCSGNEGRVSEEVKLDLNDLGWDELPWTEREDDE